MTPHDYRWMADMLGHAPFTDDTIHDPADCPYCGGDGYVEVRHPELDDVVMGEATLTEPCHCPAGEAWRRDVYDDPGYDPED